VHADVVVIGAGLSGLVDAILLAETGRKVVVLEQHTIPGGYLQQFHRKGTAFDVGFHYMGSTLPGRPMHQMLAHLGILDRLTLLPFAEESAIDVVHGGRRFGYPARFDRFVEKARATWPHEGAAIDRIVADIDGVCGDFKWFALKKGRDYQHPRDLPFAPISFDEYITPIVSDPWLREVLSFQTFNLGLHAHEIPWVKHTLAFRSNFDLTSRISGGGGALVDALVARGKELGVEHRLRSEVVSFACEGREVRSVETARGDRISADLFIGACHPKPLLRCIKDEDLNPIFKERIHEMRDARGALQVFLRLKEPVRSLGAPCVMIHDDEEAQGDPPLSVVLVSDPCALEGAAGGARLEAMTYMDHAPFAAWSDRPVFKRGPGYDRLKGDLAQRVIRMIAKVAPELPELILDVYAATPLSDQWYTRNEHGAVFGVSHDVGQQGMNRPQPRMRLKNLFFTGHSITMPGICGVFINAFDTCDMLRGDGTLFELVAT